jgi:antitoxin (DNA-binding transcriptional repressor) of toxin-antitoxin stability system
MASLTQGGREEELRKPAAKEPVARMRVDGPDCNYVNYVIVKRRTISATALARQVGDVLGRIRYRGESFIVERNGVPVARIDPAQPVLAGSVGEGLAAWRDAGKADLEFAVLLEQLGRADAVPGNPWAS